MKEVEVTRVYLLRHGQVVDHHEFRYNGHCDVDITAHGVAQMERAAGFLEERSVAAVYSSDLQRAVKGARIIGGRLGLAPVEVAELKELHLGRWEGMTREEAAEKYPEEAHFSFADLVSGKLKGGESLEDLAVRVIPAFDQLVERHRGESIVLVAHGGVNRVLLGAAMGIAIKNFFSIEQDYGCINLIDAFSDNNNVVKLLNGGPNQELAPTKIY